MKLKVILFFLVIFANNLLAQEFSWVKTYGSDQADICYFNKADQNGNVYVTGSFKGDIDFDNSGNYHFSSKGEDDMFLLKLNVDGDIQWVKTIGGTLIDKGVGIAIDQNNDIYVTGDFQSADVDFDGTGMNTISSLGNEDMFLLKYDANGNLLKKTIFGSGGKEAGIALHIDSENNLLVTGFFASVVDFDPGDNVHNLHSAGSIDGFILKMDSQGNYIWAKAFSGEDWVKGLFVTTDSHDNYYITGYFRATADFNPDRNESFELEAKGLRDFYIVKLDNNGHFLWGGGIGSTEEDRAISLAVDANDDLLLGGYFGNSADFDIGSEEHILNSAGSSDAYLLKIDKDGSFVWVKQFGNSGDDRIREVKIDNEGSILLSGQFQNTVDFDPSSNINEHSSNGNTDIFILKLDANGDYLWTKTIGGLAIDEAFAMSLDNSKHIYLSGIFTAEVDFDFGAATNNIASNGAKDIFILKILDNTNTTITKVESIKTPSVGIIKVFPNPTTDDITIKVEKLFEAVSWQLYDLSAKQIRFGTLTNNTVLQLSDLVSGSYLLQIVNNKGEIKTTKIIKQ